MKYPNVQADSATVTAKMTVKNVLDQLIPEYVNLLAHVHHIHVSRTSTCIVGKCLNILKMFKIFLLSFIQVPFDQIFAVYKLLVLSHIFIDFLL